MPDNWKHRSMSMACRTCIHFVPKERKNKKRTSLPVLGRCRRHSPTLGGWPAVFETDWCGDHKLDEEKM